MQKRFNRCVFLIRGVGNMNHKIFFLRPQIKTKRAKEMEFILCLVRARLDVR
jgi:hypothetical protein